MKKRYNGVIYLLINLALFLFGVLAYSQNKAPEIFSPEWGTYVVKQALPRHSSTTEPARIPQPKIVINSVNTNLGNSVLNRQVEIFDRNENIMRAMSIWRNSSRMINSNHDSEQWRNYLEAFNINYKDPQ